ncbi:MAG: hypothetical protein LBC18_06045 [Opitutaceae bacterium]|jgi:hypothetical protein|nr:hypothetical protein [Opitutaceae bacterium]
MSPWVNPKSQIPNPKKISKAEKIPNFKNSPVAAAPPCYRAAAATAPHRHRPAIAAPAAAARCPAAIPPRAAAAAPPSRRTARHRPVPPRYRRRVTPFEIWDFPTGTWDLRARRAATILRNIFASCFLRSIPFCVLRPLPLNSHPTII